MKQRYFSRKNYNSEKEMLDDMMKYIRELESQAEQITKLEERVRELEEVFSEFKIEKDADGKMVIQYWSGGGVVVENNKEDSIAGQVLYDLANHLLNKQQS